MPISFNKKNLVNLLLIANLERKKGGFLDPLIEHLSDAVDQYNKGHKVAKNKVSRATMFDYLREIDYFVGGSYTQKQVINLARLFDKKQTQKSKKYYNQFNNILFNALYDFLVSNDAFDRDKMLDTVSGIDNSLYFAMASFLGIDKKQMNKDCERLPGFFRVYRPSLSMKGKVIVSCACISVTENDAILYNEIMHYKYRNHWRRLLYNGYIVRQKSHFLLLTTDTNTNLLQLTILKAKYIHEDKIHTLSGAYNGASNNVKTGLYSTGIHFVREEFSLEGDTPFEDWNVGSIPRMGLIDRPKIEEEIREDLFNYPQDYRK